VCGQALCIVTIAFCEDCVLDCSVALRIANAQHALRKPIMHVESAGNWTLHLWRLLY